MCVISNVSEMWRALLKRISWVSGGHAAIARRVFLCAGHHGWYSPKFSVGKQVVVRAASRRGLGFPDVPCDFQTSAPELSVAAQVVC